MCAASSVAATGLEGSLSFGAESIGDDLAVSVEAVADQGPIPPDNVLFDDISTDRDRRILSFRNTTIAAIVVTYLAVTNPV